MFFNVSEVNETFNKKTTNIDFIARAKLPIKKTNDAEIIVFKYNNEPKDYFCILIGKVNKKNTSNLIQQSEFIANV